MERTALTYQPIVKIFVQDVFFANNQWRVTAEEETRKKIDKHIAIEKHKANTYELGLLFKKEVEHRSTEVLLETDGSLKGSSQTYIKETYDYKESDAEYVRKVTIDEVIKEDITTDLSDHLFENSLLLKFYFQIDSLLIGSVFPQDNTEPKLIFIDDLPAPDPDEFRKKDITITTTVNKAKQYEFVHAEIEEEGKVLKKVTKFNLEDKALLAFHVSIPRHLNNFNPITYRIHLKYKIINNP